MLPIFYLLIQKILLLKVYQKEIEMSAKICQEEVYGSIFYHTEIINPSNIHTEICHLLVALCNDHNYTCEYIYERYSLYLLGCIFYWCLRERIGTEVPGKGMRTAFTEGPLSIVLLKCYPVTSFQLCMKGNFMPVFLARGLRLCALPEATQLVNGRAGLWRGRSGLPTASGLGLPMLVPRSRSHLLRKELLPIPSGRWGNWVLEQIAPSEVSDSILMQACHGQLDFMAVWPQWKQTTDLGPRGLAQCPQFLHYTLLGVTAGWLRWKCTSYLEGITQKANISLEQSQATLCPNSTLNLFRFLSSNCLFVCLFICK